MAGMVNVNIEFGDELRRRLAAMTPEQIKLGMQVAMERAVDTIRYGTRVDYAVRIHDNRVLYPVRPECFEDEAIVFHDADTVLEFEVAALEDTELE
jgi:hypothetical protein